jgi:hypothetical protein
MPDQNTSQYFTVDIVIRILQKINIVAIVLPLS